MIGAGPLKTAVVRKLRAEFNTTLPGLTGLPLIIQDRPKPTTPEPYIYVFISPGNINEVEKTKIGGAYDYIVTVQVMTRAPHSGDSKELRDLMASEVQSILDYGEAIDLVNDGFNNYVQTVESITPLESQERGADYYYTNIDILFRMSFVGLPVNIGPTQAPSFTFSLFTYPPQSNRIERYDAGIITPATTYPSPNNGFNFIDAGYSISAGAGGTFANGDYDVPLTADPVRLDSSLRYEFDEDTSVTHTLTATTDFPRIDSIRYGAITPQTPGTIPTLSDDTSATYGLRNLSNWNIEYGTVRPHNETVTITGNADQFVYIIIDHEVTLTQIVNTIGQNVIAQFTESTIGDYKVYFNNNPIVFDGFSTDFTLIA